jgi:hypothetical protein
LKTASAIPLFLLLQHISRIDIELFWERQACTACFLKEFGAISGNVSTNRKEGIKIRMLTVHDLSKLDANSKVFSVMVDKNHCVNILKEELKNNE